MKKMYKKPKKNCKVCGGSGYWVEHYGGDFDFFNKYRCGCSKRKTKKYKRALKKHKNLKEFYDNNSNCNTHIVDEYRSW